MFERGLDGSHSRLVFVEPRTWLLRIRFFPNKSLCRLIEGVEWLRNFVRRTAPTGLLELYGDSDMSWAVPRRARDINTAEVCAYAKSDEPPITFARCPLGTQSLDMAERRQK